MHLSLRLARRVVAFIFRGSTGEQHGPHRRLATVLKAAPHAIIQTTGFSSFILRESAIVLQDETGVPLEFFENSTSAAYVAPWQLALHGNLARLMVAYRVLAISPE